MGENGRESKNKPQAVSIQTVARAANVSIATVSRVINNSSLVSPETSAKVRGAIEKLGFRPNRFAQGLMTHRSRVLGISLPDLHGEFYSALMRAADARARTHGYHLLVGTEPHRNDPAGGDFYMPLGLLDGLAVMITEPNERLLRQARTAAVPVVLIDAEVLDPRLDSVQVDNTIGTRQAVEHLLKSVAPARCYFVGGPAANYDAVERSESFLATLRRRGGGTTPDQVSFGDYSVEWGREWAQKAIAAGRLKGSGVLAGNDEIAWGIMQAAQGAGIDVPGDLQVIGFDNTRLSTLVQPRLSTVGVPLADLGAAAVDLLIRRINDRAAEPEHVRLETSLVVRESSGG